MQVNRGVLRAMGFEMRFSLTDLLLHVGVFSCSSFIGAMLSAGGASTLLMVGITTALATVGVLGLLPPLYRWRRLLPLRLPPCPHCTRTPFGYQTLAGEWPSAEVRCSAVSYTHLTLPTILRV